MTGGPKVVEAVPVAGVDEIARATAGGRWTLRWRGWADWSLSRATIVLAAAAVALDVTTAWTGVSLGALGRIPISPALPLALVLVARLHARRPGGPVRAGPPGASSPSASASSWPSRPSGTASPWDVRSRRSG